MGRTPQFSRWERIVRVARYCDHHGVSTREGLERLAEARHDFSRREFLGAMGSAAALGWAGAMSGRRQRAAGHLASADVAVVGAGLAGLACADALQGHRIAATVYEAREARVGGRVFSLGGAFPGPVSFPGKVVERGAELIDTGHVTMRGYANRFGLTLENLVREPGDVYYFFDLDGSGFRHYSEEEVVDEYRDLVTCMRRTLRGSAIRNEVVADGATPAEIVLDLTSLRQYLEVDCAGFGGALIRKAIEAAYTIEYGCEIDDLSCLAFLFFIHADRRSEWREFGVFSDEKFHVVQGNQAIAAGLAGGLEKPVVFGHALSAVAPGSDGRVRLTFEGGATAVHDAVVLAIPNPVLRLVDLHPDLVPPWKQAVIQNIGYGDNAKMMVGFESRLWLQQFGSNGLGYANLPAIQATWESSPTAPGNPVITNYTGGDLTRSLSADAQAETERFLDDFDRIFPGAKARATGSSGARLTHLENWTHDPFTRGAYTCNQPGYFTSIAGLEGTPTHPIYFAGEHTDSFYDWQGFMEGAALSGLRAASEIVKAKIGAKARHVLTG